MLQWAVEPSGGGWTESMLQRVSSGVHFSPSSDEQFYMTRRVCVCVLHVPRCFIWWAWLCWRSSSSWRTAVVTMTSCLTTPPKLHVSNKTQSFGVQFKFSYLIGRLWRKKHHTLTHCLFVFILCVCVCVCVGPGESPSPSGSILALLETLQNAPHLEVHKDLITWILKVMTVVMTSHLDVHF